MTHSDVRNGRPAAFLDRDGVLNVDTGYLHRPQDCVWKKNVPYALSLLRKSGFMIVVVTNQSGVARGHYSESDVNALHRWMNAQLQREGANVDAFYYCPHHPDGSIKKYSVVSDRRKPAPGMLLEAIDEHGIDPSASLLIGDRETDLQAAEAAGVRGYLFNGDDLGHFVDWLLKHHDLSVLS